MAPPMFDEEADLVHDAVFRVGQVIAVDGRRVRVSVDKLKNSSHLLYKGGIVRNVAVASYVKITKGFVELIAKVDSEHVEEDRGAPQQYQRTADRLIRVLDVSLIGYLENGHFERGVREMPLLENECFILTEHEFNLLHDFVDASDTSLILGSLAMEPSQAVSVGVNSVFASHVGIFGNTGSGKSYTLAKLYYELFREFGGKPGFRSKSQFMLIDFNGEYANRTGAVGERSTEVIAGDDLKEVYELCTTDDGGDKLPLPRTAIYDQTFWSVLLDATEKTQAPFIARVLKARYWDDLLPDAAALLDVVADLVARATKSTDVTLDRRLAVNFLEEISNCLGGSTTREFTLLIEDFRYNLEYHGRGASFYWRHDDQGQQRWANEESWDRFIQNKIKSVPQTFESVTDIDLVRFKLVMQFYRDVISGYSNREHLAPLLKRMDERVPSIKRLVIVSDDALAVKPLTVVSLRRVNLDMRKVIPMILCKHLYDQKKERDPAGERYLNLIIDEAHNILSTTSSRESEAWRDYRLETFEEIIKEGRKFGVFLTIASQRPHDISPTIISQLHNYFLHRLVNNLDILAVEKSVAYLDKVSHESLPILPTGTCVLAGVSAQVPIVLKIGRLPAEAEPNSQTISVTAEWLKPPPLPRSPWDDDPWAPS
ncbi:ATP-binding protein [Isoptericola sp. NPDC019693]|uniref:ATP-binding protein n=1 Tax=Isoptericola sp. NPDC019693 TaxID=3364009 RepID=UPI00378CB514